jgi:putative membrane protein
MMDNDWSMSGGDWIWTIVMIGVGALLIALIARMVVSSSAPPRDIGSDDAHTILRKRFAAGEINEDEFNRKRAALNPRDGPATPSSQP